MCSQVFGDYKSKRWTVVTSDSSIGSSGRVGGAKKHEIYVVAFGGHLFYDLFVQGWGAMAPSAPPLDPGGAGSSKCSLSGCVHIPHEPQQYPLIHSQLHPVSLHSWSPHSFTATPRITAQLISAFIHSYNPYHCTAVLGRGLSGSHQGVTRISQF